MIRTFVELPVFRVRWKELGLNDDDLKRLQEEILLNPKMGTVMKGTGGIRKLRFSFTNKGKRGSIRVIYIDFEVYEKIYLITAYSKSEKDNLSKAERNELRELMRILEYQLKSNEKKV